MSQIIGGHTFVPLEKNIDDVKLNAITGGATITSELISTQTATTSTGSGDYFLLLQSGGTLAKILTSDLANSLGSSSGMMGAITNVRLRSFSSVGNPNFECDQVSVGATVPGANGKIIDRWFVQKSGTMVVSAGQNAAASGDVFVPGTSFRISRNFLRVTLSTVQVSLGTSDFLQIASIVEGSRWRELSLDVHSVSLLVRSSVPGLKFGLTLVDSPTTKSLTTLCTIPSSGVWTLITCPNLPVWPVGNFSSNPGALGYVFVIALAAGVSATSPTNGVWQGASYTGAQGQSNFAANLVGSTFDVAFVQHEPGSQCTTLIDKPWTQNYDECLRYLQKSYDYGTAIGTASAGSYICGTNFSGTNSFFVGHRYRKELAKSVTPTIYSYGSGAANSFDYYARGFGAVNSTVSSISSAGASGFGSIYQSGGTGADSICYVHYTADTGW